MHFPVSGDQFATHERDIFRLQDETGNCTRRSRPEQTADREGLPRATLTTPVARTSPDHR